MKITLSKYVTTNYEIFITVNMEAVIKPVMVHKTTLMDLHIEDQVKTNRALGVSKKRSLSNLKKTYSQANNTDKDTVKETSVKLEGSEVSL